MVRGFFIDLRTNLKNEFGVCEYDDLKLSYLFDHIHDNIFSETYQETKNENINI